MVLQCLIKSSRRSRIFLRRGPLSCEVPSRRDSVGGGVVAEFFRGPKADVIQWGGGGSSRNFPGSKSRCDSVVASNFQRGGPGSQNGRYYPLLHCYALQKGGARAPRAPPLNRPLKSVIAFCLHHQRLPTLPLEFIIVCKPPNRGCT